MRAMRTQKKKPTEQPLIVGGLVEVSDGRDRMEASRLSSLGPGLANEP
jgi:hypothetical protein